MRILMSMDRGGWSIPGGHRRQLLKTADALRSLGLEVRTQEFSDDGLEWADVVHSFGLDLAQLRRSRVAGRAVAVSTIYWGANYTTRPLGPSLLPILRSAAGQALREAHMRIGATAGRPVGPVLRSPSRELALAYESADVLLPNAAGEARAIERELGVSTPSMVVPNAVDPSIFQLPSDPTAERRGVICVGRIEPHKNQLALIRALRGTNVPLTIVGPPHPHHGDYLERCQAEAGPAVEFVGNTDEADLPALLHRHRTHVAPSLFETTGLVSLEAALAGCGVVSTGRGWAHEYLGADARYCNPWSVRSIRSATLAAEATPASSRLRSRILDRYTWHHAAHATATAYEVICERRRRTR